MKKTFLAGAICIASLMACNNSTDIKDMAKDANAQKADSSAKNNDNMSASDMKQDDNFAVAAADGGMTEIECSKLVQGSTNPDIKKLADMIIADHMKAGDELKGIAQKNNITLPATLSDGGQKAVDGLKAMKEPDMDKSYVEQMETDHEETIKKFQTEADKGTNADLKAWAQATLPTLQKHLDMVQGVKKAMK